MDARDVRQEENAALAAQQEAYKSFLAEFSLFELEGKTVVPVLGLAGTGKSTTVGVQLGGIYQREEGEEGFDRTGGRIGVEYPVVSDSYHSCTLNVKAFTDDEADVMYLDTAGFKDTDGDDTRAWTNYSLRLMLSTVMAFRSVVVVASYTKTLTRGGENIRGLAEELDKILLGENCFYDSMVFVITDIYANATVERIEQRLDEILVSLQNQKSSSLNWLRRECPLSMAEHAAGLAQRGAEGAAQVVRAGATGAANMVRVVVRGARRLGEVITGHAEEADGAEEQKAQNATGEVDDEREVDVAVPDYVPQERELQFDVKKAEEEHPDRLKNYISLLRQIRLITTMRDSGRIVLSHPDGPEKCQAIREDLLVKIRGTAAIRRRKLLEVSKRSTRNNCFEVQDIVSRLAARYMQNLSVELAALKLYRDSRGEFQDDIDAVRSNDRGGIKGRVDNQLTRISTAIEKKEDEIQAKSESIAPEAFYSELVSDKFPTCCWLLSCLVGVGWREKTFRYYGQRSIKVGYFESDGEMPRTTYCQPRVRVDKAHGSDKTEQSLVVDLASHYGYELNAKVVLYAKEKDTPQTNTLIALRRQEIADLEREREWLLLYQSALESRDNAGVIALIESRSKGALRGLKEAGQVFEEQVDVDRSGEFGEPPTERDVIRNMASLFTIIDRTQGWDSSLPDASRQISRAFLACHAEVVSIGDEYPFVYGGVPRLAAYSLDPEVRSLAEEPEEQQEKRADEPTSISSKASMFGGYLVGFSQFAIGGAAIASGLMLSSQVITLGEHPPLRNYMLLANVLVAAGTFWVLAALQRGGVNLMRRVDEYINRVFKGVGRKTDRISDPMVREFIKTLVVAQRVSDRTARGVVGAANQLASNVYLDARVNLKSIGFGSLFSLFGVKLWDQIWPSDTPPRPGPHR